MERDDVEANLNSQYGRTPLSWAAAGKRESWMTGLNQEAVVEPLLMKDFVNMNTTDIDDRMALSLAAGEDHYTRVKFLLATGGIDRVSKNTDGRTPLLWAPA